MDEESGAAFFAINAGYQFAEAGLKFKVAYRMQRNPDETGQTRQYPALGSTRIASLEGPPGAPVRALADF